TPKTLTAATPPLMTALARRIADRAGDRSALRLSHSTTAYPKARAPHLLATKIDPASGGRPNEASVRAGERRYDRPTRSITTAATMNMVFTDLPYDFAAR